MEEASKLTVATQGVFDILEANQTALGLTDVWYGEQLRIPRTPCIAVESGNVTRELAGMAQPGGRTVNTFTIYVIGHLSILQDVQISRKQVDELMEAVEAVLSADTSWGGTVIHGYPTSYEPGYSTRQGESFRSGRLTLQGITKTRLV